jgi:transitional endoplasmic reticulum ATPase
VSLLVVFFLIFVVMAVMSNAAARRRRRQEEERRRREAELIGRGGGAPPSPFGGTPFGMLFDGLFSGAGGWSRGYTLDPQTGRWVEVTDYDQPTATATASDTEPPAADDATREERRAAARRQRRNRAQTAAPPSLFGNLGGLGGAGGDGSGQFDVQSPDELIDFDEVGGMDELKQEVRDTVGLVLKHPEDAQRYGIEWNGILLHGAPGVGKTYFAQAIAGEYGLNFIHVSTGDLVAGIVGQSARNIDKSFETAMQNLPCLLFFDEFDSVAQRRDNTPDQESRRTVNQLLTSLEQYRDERRLLVMAATNSIEHLDQAVIRPGRFDRHIRIDLPDAEARRAVILAELENRPVAEGIEVDDLVRRTEGMTPAAIEKVIDTAALDVFKQAAESGRRVGLDTQHLLTAIERYGGQDRPTVEHWTWESLVLPAPVKAQLRQLQAVIEDAEAARRFGVDPPTGLLLAGPPGTGKTTVAKVLAAQARASFYPVSGADVMSKWVGESESNIRRLFERARENRPSIVFIDEIDAIAPRRGDVSVHDSQVNQLLAEIDGVSGQRGVFVVGATNRPDQLDPALLRGGRLSRTIVLGLPDEEGRLAILRLHTARMPTVGVDLAAVARETEGLSPADLKALAQEAALAAMARTGGGDSPSVTQNDFSEALARVSDRGAAAAGF